MTQYDNKDWRPIDGINGAFIASDGTVIRNGKYRKASIGKNGYKTVVFSVNNRSVTKTVHRMIALAFVPGYEEGKEVCHINGDRLDNRPENLRWGTRKENVADAIRHGTATVGANNGSAKLRKSDIAFIKDMYSMGFFASEIAPHFNVSKGTIYRVTSGHTYKGVNA